MALKNVIKLDNIIKLDEMKNIPIDEIINLYKHGYDINLGINNEIEHNLNINNEIEHNLEISNESFIKILAVANPDIIDTTAYYDGTNTYALILWGNPGSYGFAQLVVYEGANWRGQTPDACWDPRLNLRYLTRIGPMSISNLGSNLEARAYRCDQDFQTCAPTASCTGLVRTETFAGISIRGLDTTSPLAPTGLTVTPGDGQLAASWNAVTNTPIFAYYFSIKETISGNIIDFGYLEYTQRNITIANLTNGIEYTVNVKAINHSYVQGAIATGTGTPQAPLTCQSISNVSADPTSVTVGGSVSLSAVVSPTTASFTVEFIDQNNTVRASAPSTINSGIAATSWNTTGVTPGTYNLKARSGQCLSTTPTGVTVNSPQVTCSSISNVTATPSTFVLGNSTQLSATVTPSSPGALTIEFIDSDTNTLLGTGTSCSTTSGNNTCSVIWTPAIDRVYNVKARVGTQCSSPSAIQVTVNPSGVTCSSISNVTANPTNLMLGESVTLSATVTPSSPGALTIQFIDIETNDVLGTCNTTSINNTCSVVWTPITEKIYSIKAKVGAQCISSTAIAVNVTAAPVQAGFGGAGMLLILGAGLYFLMKK